MLPKRRRLRLLREIDETDDVPTNSKHLSPLSEDIILKILDLLPPKSLFRFKCLSKGWHDLIANPSLVNSCCSQRLRLSPSMRGFFFQHSKVRRLAGPKFLFTSIEGKELINTSDMSLCFLRQLVIIVGSSNGFLLCCRNRRHPMRYYVCNPYTRQWVALPKPRNCYYKVAVGFDCKINDMHNDIVCYKIVRFRVACASQTMMTSLPIETFSSDTGKWMSINLKAEVPFHLWPIDKPAIVIDEVFYWLDISCRIIACDLKKGLAWEMVFPSPQLLYKSNCLGSSDSLQYGLSDCRNLEVWVLDRNYYRNHIKWLKHSVSLTLLGEEHPKIFGLSFDGQYRIDLKGFHPSNPSIIFFIVKNKMVSYDIESGVLEVHHTFIQPWSMSTDELNFFAWEWLEWPRALSY